LQLDTETRFIKVIIENTGKFQAVSAVKGSYRALLEQAPFPRVSGSAGGFLAR